MSNLFLTLPDVDNTRVNPHNVCEFYTPAKWEHEKQTDNQRVAFSLLVVYVGGQGKCLDFPTREARDRGIAMLEGARPPVETAAAGWHPEGIPIGELGSQLETARRFMCKHVGHLQANLRVWLEHRVVRGGGPGGRDLEAAAFRWEHDGGVPFLVLPMAGLRGSP